MKKLLEEALAVLDDTNGETKSDRKRINFASDNIRTALSMHLKQEQPTLQEQKSLSDQEVMDAIKHISFNEMTAFNIARALEDYRLKNK